MEMDTWNGLLLLAYTDGVVLATLRLTDLHDDTNGRLTVVIQEALLNRNDVRLKRKIKIMSW